MSSSPTVPAARVSSTAAGDLAPVTLERGTDSPLHRQLYRELRERILGGGLKPGTRLPATRMLARDLGVSRNTVVTAYEQLAAEGFVTQQVGHGTRVAATVLGERSSQSEPATATDFELSASGQRLSTPHRTLPDARYATAPFQPGVPDVTAFPRAIWSRLVGRAMRYPATGVEAYAHAGGYGPLRETLAAYLAGSRGVRCEPEQVLVMTTAQAAVDLATRMLCDAGDRAFVECPGYVGARAAFTAHGLAVRGVPVDSGGVRVDELLAGDSRERIGYVTPSHQFPTGATLALERRLALIHWADARRGWLVEDDYDSEFRYADRPIAAVQGLEPGARVVYVGSFAKTLFPGLRVACLVVPRPLATAFRQALRQTGQEPALPLQAALHDFIEQGHFARHVRRMRAVYAERQALLREALDRTLPALGRPRAANGGLQLLFDLAAGSDDVALARGAREAGFGVEALGRYAGGESLAPGLVFGVGTCAERDIDRQVARLGEVLNAL